MQCWAADYAIIYLRTAISDLNVGSNGCKEADTQTAR
jgi:hypothetical protein